MTFSMTCSTWSRKWDLFEMCVFSEWKTKVVKVRHLHFIMFCWGLFNDFSTLIFVWNFHDFGNHFGFIFHAFSTLWPSFWHTFSMLFFSWFSDTILVDLWTPISGTNSNPRRHFFQKKHVFSWFRSGHRFLLDFEGFWEDVGVNLPYFSCNLRPISDTFRHLDVV